MGNIITVEEKYRPAIEALTIKQCASGKNTQKRASRPNAEINREGIIAEFAMCKYFALDPLEHVTRDGSDGGVDLVLPGSDKTLQIKYTPVKRGVLIAGDNQPITADVAIMTVSGGRQLDVRVVGHITRDDFYGQARRKHFQPHLPLDYYVPQTALRPMRDIWGVV